MVYEKELDALLKKMVKVYEQVEEDEFKWHITTNKEEKTWTNKEGHLRNEIKLNIVITESFDVE